MRKCVSCGWVCVCVRMDGWRDGWRYLDLPYSNAKYKTVSQYIHTPTHTYMHTSTHTPTHTSTHTHIYIHTPKHTYIHTPTHTNTNTNIHTYIHQHIHTYLQLLADEMSKLGKEMDNTLCHHFALTRQELFHVVLINEIKSFDELYDAHSTDTGGTYRGCETCRPAGVYAFLIFFKKKYAYRRYPSLFNTN